MLSFLRIFLWFITEPFSIQVLLAATPFQGVLTPYADVPYIRRFVRSFSSMWHRICDKIQCGRLLLKAVLGLQIVNQEMRKICRCLSCALKRAKKNYGNRYKDIYYWRRQEERSRANTRYVCWNKKTRLKANTKVHTVIMAVIIRRLTLR